MTYDTGESIIRHAKDDPWCDEAMELNRSLSKVYGLEAEVRRLDEQLLIAAMHSRSTLIKGPIQLLKQWLPQELERDSNTNGSYTRYREIDRAH